MAFIRQGELKVIATYDTSNMGELVQQWNAVRSHEFCPTGSCPFRLEKKANFSWDSKNFLYYRARAITANTPNGNGDMFPDEELGKSHLTFIGKGVYYNHNSDDPLKAFGMILDAAWSPHYQPDLEDKYIEILGAIDKELIEQKHPGMLRQIEAGILLSTSMGCWQAGSKVLLGDYSQRNIEDVRIGDTVITHTGETSPVTKLFKRWHRGPAFEVQVCGIPEALTITPEHPFWVLSSKQVSQSAKVRHKVAVGTSLEISAAEGLIFDMKPSFVHAAHLVKGDYLAIPIPTAISTPKYATEDLARLMGYYLSEGWILRDRTKIRGVGFSFNIKEVNFHKEVCELIYHLTGKTARVQHCPSKNSTQVRVHDKKLAALLLGLCGEKAHTKKLHPSVLSWAPQLQLQIVGTFINGDGFCTRTGKEAKSHTTYLESTSYNLVSQLCLLLSRNRILWNMERKEYAPMPGWNSKVTTTWRAAISPFFSDRMSKVSAKTPLEAPTGSKFGKFFYQNCLWLKIDKVTIKDYNDYVYNLEVDGDHSYVSNLIANHNCIAERAVCSICDNIATQVPNLCVHMHPKSMYYCKGKRVEGKLAYETNYGITFTEDSFVPTPADSTAHVFEILASKKNAEMGNLDRLASHFNTYWQHKNPGADAPATPLVASEKTLFKSAAPAEALETKPAKTPKEKVEETAVSKISDIKELVKTEDGRKLVHHIRQIIDDEWRKVFGPILKELDVAVRPQIQKEVAEEAGKVKRDLNLSTTPKEATKEANLVIFTENFQHWSSEDKQKLIDAIRRGGSYNFDAILEDE